jgi:hypothetical protein
MGMASGVPWWTVVLPIRRSIMVMTPMPPVEEQMEKRTGKQKKIGQYPEHMRPVFGDEEKSQDSEKRADNKPS